MKNIIPFKKDVIFKTNLSEITSISLENTLSLNNDIMSGDFIVSGEYKISDNSKSVEPFEFKIPFEIAMDERFDTSKATIDIDDFYYEIVNNNVLSVSIDVLIDKLSEKPLIYKEVFTDVNPEREVIEIEDDSKEEIRKIEKVGEIKEISIEPKTSKSDIKEEKEIEVLEERQTEKEQVEEKINSLFNQFNSDSEVYVTYNVFILRDGDTIESIMEKYNVTEEELKKYNDLSDLKLGDKIIIPNTYERD